MLSIAVATALSFTGCSNNDTASDSVITGNSVNAGNVGDSGNTGGGSGNSGEDSTGAAAFVDEPVKGMTYVCAPSMKKGLTNDTGAFFCEAGDEKVKFLLGSYFIGETTSVSDIVTPVTLFPNDVESSTNLAQLLQTLDVDGDVSNGLDLTTPAALHFIDMLSDKSDALKLTSSDFDVMLTDTLGVEIVSEERAHSNMNAYLGSQGLLQAGELYKISNQYSISYDANGSMVAGPSYNKNFFYDADKNLIKFDDSGLRIENYTYRYNSLGKLVEKTTTPETFSYKYKVFYLDPLGDHNRTEVTLELTDNYDIKTETYTYNENNQIVSIDETHTAETYFSSISTRFEYNDAGLLTKKYTRYPTVSGPNSATPGVEGYIDVLIIEKAYDAVNRIVSYRNHEKRDRLRYAYDGNKTIINKTEFLTDMPLSRTENEYNDDGTLSKVTLDTFATNSTRAVTTYTYDTKGKLTEELTTVNEVTAMPGAVVAIGELLSTTTDTYTYDESGNLIQNVSEFDGISRSTTTTTDYTYNALNKIATKSETSGGETTTETYTYDANGYLTEKKTEYPDGTSEVERTTWTNQYGVVGEDT